MKQVIIIALALTLAGCSMTARQKQGALIGGGLGAVTGAIIGSAHGNAGSALGGAAIGAIGGGLLGAAVSR